MSDLLKQASNFLTPRMWHKGRYSEIRLDDNRPKFCVLGAVGAAAYWGSPAGVPTFGDDEDAEGCIADFFDEHKQEDGDQTAMAELHALSEAIHEREWCKITTHPRARCNHGDHPEEWVEHLIVCIASFNDDQYTSLEQVQQIVTRAQEIIDEQAP